MHTTRHPALLPCLDGMVWVVVTVEWTTATLSDSRGVSVVLVRQKADMHGVQSWPWVTSIENEGEDYATMEDAQRAVEQRMAEALAARSVAQMTPVNPR